MENELITKRRLIILLVIATVVIFVALVWLIAKSLPWGRGGTQDPTATTGVLVARDCTHPVGYWKDHPELFPAQMIIGGIAYQDRELEALLSDDSQELSQQLKVQMAVAFMNNQAGADQGPIEAVLFEAYGWLVQHPTGSETTAEDVVAGQQLFNELERYNLGLGEVTACETAFSVTKTGTGTGISATELLQLSGTPTLTGTPTSTETLPPGVGFPTTQVTTFSTPTPSATHPHATNTPVNTTQAPTSTKTKPPAPTFTPTHTPEPPTPTNTTEPPTPTYTLVPLPTPTWTLVPPP